MIAKVLSKLFALLLAALLLATVAVFPADKRILGGALALAAAILIARPMLWLLFVPALLPVLDFTPWTGWFFVEDLDLLLLVCAAVAYWRLGDQPPAVALPTWQRVLLILFGCCVALSAWIGLQPLAPLDGNAFSSYSSHYNSLRTVKGYVWAMVLLPLMRRSAARDAEWLAHYFVPGMLLGLAGTCLAVMWERFTFPGLLNFSSDYRPTAPFSAMHTGGAALDAYLAISFPYVLFWLIGVHSRLKLALGLLLLTMGCYAGFALFSRDIYLAYGGSLACLGLLAFSHRLQHGHVSWGSLLGKALLLAIVSFALFRVFATGGYRGLLAGMILMGAAVVLAGGERRPVGAAGIATALIGAAALCGLDLALVAWLQDSPFGGIGKGPYLAFILSAALFAAGAALRQRGTLVAMAAAPSLALCTALVAMHWGGAAAGIDSAILIGVATAFVVLNRRLDKPLVHFNRHTMTAALFSAIVLVILIPISNSYYFTTRFSTVGDDAGVRLRHWNEALLMMTPDLGTTTFGMGLGTYPSTYFWKNVHGEIPGSFSYQDEDQGRNRFLRLNTARYEAGYGEVLRMLQPVSARTGARYKLSFDLRRSGAATQFILGVCGRWLIYPQDCAYPKLNLREPDGKWQHYEVQLDTAKASWPAAMPTQFEMEVDGTQGYADVDNISLTDQGTGQELISNGNFSRTNDYWFFSSDRNHFPWHIKNFFVNSYFELGAVGAAMLGLLLLSSFGMLAARGLAGDVPATIQLAAMIGFLLTGLFDSLFDVPRLVLVFFLVLYAASLRPVRPPAERRGQQRRRRRVPAQEAAEVGA